jgi:hypothetical protein
MYIQEKIAKGITYRYVVEDRRDGKGRRRVKHLAHLGREPTLRAAYHTSIVAMGLAARLLTEASEALEKRPTSKVAAGKVRAATGKMERAVGRFRLLDGLLLAMEEEL